MGPPEFEAHTQGEEHLGLVLGESFGVGEVSANAPGLFILGIIEKTAIAKLGLKGRGFFFVWSRAHGVILMRCVH